MAVQSAHSYLILETEIHSVLSSRCPTDILRLLPAKRFLVLKKSPKLYCWLVTNLETTAKSMIQLPELCNNYYSTVNAQRETAAPWVFAYRKTYQSPFICHRDEAEECIAHKACKKPGREPGWFHCMQKGSISPTWGDRRQLSWLKKRDCQVLGSLFQKQGQGKPMWKLHYLASI